jgi:hypothetical protein
MATATAIAIPGKNIQLFTSLTNLDLDINLCVVL